MLDLATRPICMTRFLRAVVLLFCLSGCFRQTPEPIPSPAASGELVVLVRATAAEFGQAEMSSLLAFESDLVRAFAQSLNLRVKFVRVNNFEAVAESLGTFQAHMAIGMVTTDWPAKVRFSIPLKKLHYTLVQHEGKKSDGSNTTLAARTLGVLPGSAAAYRAENLTRDQPTLAVLHASRVRDEMQLLRAVAVGKLDMALTDELHYKLASRFYPTLQKFRELPEPTQWVWAFPPGPANEFLPEADAFIERARNNGLISRLLDRHLNLEDGPSEEDIAVFIERMSLILPDYREEFFAAERETGIDWRLIAAIAYQESHWDPLATSPTGVRGMMMLTEETADRLNVPDRLNPRQAIAGGARYFASLRENLPDDIPEPDRSWLALASYNIGPGHMNGVIAIARSMGRDVGSWMEMKRVLPLMSRQEYAARLKAGAPRGGEAVTMAENVRTYYEILRHFQKPYASFIGPRNRAFAFEQPPRTTGLAKPVAKPQVEQKPEPAVPAIPKSLSPKLDDLDPEAAERVRERMNIGHGLNAQ
ncbi:MAG: hypothetical protein RIR70_750 [Pseudomonadota bacterium]